MSRFVRVDALLIDFGPYKNPRRTTGLSAASIIELANEIHANGLQARPIVQRAYVVPPDAGPVEVVEVVVDGQRRTLALRHLQEQGALPADYEIQVDDKDDGPRTGEPIEMTENAASDLVLDALAIGFNREGLSSFEIAQVAADLRAKGRAHAEIAARINKSETWVSRMLTAWKNATNALRDAWREGKVTDEQVKDLAVVVAKKQPEAVAEILEIRSRGDRKALSEARAKGKEKADPKKAKPGGPVAAATPPRGRIVEFVRLRKVEPPKSAYVRGLFDMAAFVTGDLPEKKLGGDYKAYLAGLAKKQETKAKPKRRRA